MVERKRQKGGNSRKIGRNLVKCARYRASHIREKNKIRKIKKHLKKYPNDLKSLRKLESLRS
jgi:hypothetical protein